MDNETSKLLIKARDMLLASECWIGSGSQMIANSELVEEIEKKLTEEKIEFKKYS